MVWERTLKVEAGRGGKKGFSHYLTDNDRDRLYGPDRNRRYEQDQHNHRVNKHREKRSRSPRRDDSFSRGRKNQSSRSYER